MTLHWSEFPDAPEVGTEICKCGDLEMGVSAITVGAFPVLLVRDGAGVRAFVNACPHQFLPLTQRSTDILSENGSRLICSNHDAAFSAETGEGTAGLGIGCALSPIPVCDSNGILWVAEG